MYNDYDTDCDIDNDIDHKEIYGWNLSPPPPP